MSNGAVESKNRGEELIRKACTNTSAVESKGNVRVCNKNKAIAMVHTIIAVILDRAFGCSLFIQSNLHTNYTGAYRINAFAFAVLCVFVI